MDDDMLLAGVVANCTTAAALLVKFPSGTRGPQGPRTLGRVGLGSREGPNVAWSLGTASTAGCPSRRACLWGGCGRAGCYDSESAASPNR